MIKTKQLQQAVNDMKEMGFTVTYRTAPEKSHNALICLRVGSFLKSVADKVDGMSYSLSVTSATSLPLGKNSRRSPLPFSLEPHCQEE